MYGAPEKERSVCMGQDRGPDVHACKLNKRIMIQDSASTEMWSTVLFCLTGICDNFLKKMNFPQGSCLYKTDASKKRGGRTWMKRIS